MKAFILGAGLGTRLRPLTFIRPKPLVPVLGKPLIQHSIRHLKKFGVGHIIINTHRLPNQYRRILGNLDKELDIKISYSHEPHLLDTGGGLKNIERFIGNKTFIMYNGDIFTNINLSKMLKFHKQKNSLATLLVSKKHQPLHISIDKSCNIKEIGPHIKPVKERIQYAFCGIHILEADIFKYIPAKRPISIISIYQSLIKKGAPIAAFPLGNALWREIGNIDLYRKIHKNLLRGRPALIGKTSKIAGTVSFSGFISIGNNCVIGKECNLKNTVIWDNVNIKDGIKIENSIITDNAVIRNSVKNRVIMGRQEMPSSGSQRKFFRFKKPAEDIVIMEYNQAKKENNYYSDILLFLEKLDINVPKLIERNLYPGTIFLEWLGNKTLYSLCSNKIGPAEMIRLYKQIIDEIIKLHVNGEKAYKEKPFPICRPFNYRLYRWESRYFERYFLSNYFKFSLGKNDKRNLQKEFRFLAKILAGQKVCLIHRDLQSKNIIIRKNKAYFIDFQGMRFGLPHYDLASLLYDPYTDMPSKIRSAIYNYYLSKIEKAQKGRKSHIADTGNFDRIYRYSGIQRLLQALGAYSYLGIESRKKEFLSYIPQAVKNLRMIIGNGENLENLKNLTENINI